MPHHSAKIEFGSGAALTFENSNDYDKINEDDKISISGLTDFKPDTSFECELEHSDGTSEKIILNHSYNSSQIEWFTAGSALNVLKNKTS